MAITSTTRTTVRKKAPTDFDPVIINGCIIEPNTIYEIVRKTPSNSSSDVYKELDSYKERMPGVSNTIALSQVNTGFFPGSSFFNSDPLLKNNWSERQKVSDSLYKIFAEPIKMYISDIENIKIPTNDEFFDRNYDRGGRNFFSTVLSEGVTYDTSNPLSRFQLYIAIIENELVMKGKRDAEELSQGLVDELDIKKSDCPYAYVSITERKKKIKAKADTAMDTSFTYGSILREDPTLLVKILGYINVPVGRESTKSELNVAYTNYIENNPEKMDYLNIMFERYDNDKDYLLKELDVLSSLNSKRGRSLLTKEGSSFYFGDKAVGSNLKSVAKAILDSEDLYKEFTLKIKP